MDTQTLAIPVLKKGKVEVELMEVAKAWVTGASANDLAAEISEKTGKNLVGSPFPAQGSVPVYRRSENALRRMRQRIFDYDDTPKEEQAARVLAYLKARVLRQRSLERRIQEATEPKGPYSGLSRRELAGTGTREPDWF